MLVKVSFNGTLLNGLFYIGNINRPLPEFRDESSEVDGMDGESFDGLTIGMRACSFEVVTVDKGKRAQQDMARMLMSILAVRKPVALTFSDELDKDGVQLVRYAVPTGSFDAEEFAVAGRWQCEFRQPDPYLYGKRRSVVLKANQAQKVEAGGNAESWPVCTANPSGSSYALTGNGKSIRFDAPFNGRGITLDHQAQRATLAFSAPNARGLLTGSRFFPMSGTMQMQANANTTVSWTERWL